MTVTEVKEEWLGARLKELRVDAGLTQGQLADQAGRTREGIAQLEIGRRQPAWDTDLAVCQASNVGCDAFLKRPEERLTPLGITLPTSLASEGLGRPRADPFQERQEVMKRYLARLCWNEHGWSRPSGVSHLAEGEAVG